MSRPARKSQMSLFETKPRAAFAPQPIARRQEAFLHLCEEPGCDAWGAFGVGVFRGVAGHWFCRSHKQNESAVA